ncbi:MAG: AIR synthase related protein [bacterium]
MVAVNLSDLAGKGGRPLGVLLSLGLPGSLDTGFLLEIRHCQILCEISDNIHPEK